MRTQVIIQQALFIAHFNTQQHGKQDGWQAEVVAQIEHLRECNKRLDYLFKKARLSLDDYEADHEQNEREIVRLQARLGSESQVLEMLKLSAESIEQMARNWNTALPEDRQSFARTIFSEIIYDLDTRRIVGFKMTAWAEAFLQMRVTLEEFYRGQNASTGVSEGYTPMPLWGFEPQFQP